MNNVLTLQCYYHRHHNNNQTVFFWLFWKKSPREKNTILSIIMFKSHINTLNDCFYRIYEWFPNVSINFHRNGIFMCDKKACAIFNWFLLNIMYLSMVTSATSTKLKHAISCLNWNGRGKICVRSLNRMKVCAACVCVSVFIKCISDFVVYSAISIVINWLVEA